MRRLLPPLILAFLLARLVFLGVSLEEVVINDELTTGLLWQWLHGARAVQLDALWSPYMGGDALYQVLALPLFAAFGASAVAVKVLALCVALAGLVLVTTLGLRLGGPRAGLFAGLCFALAPPGWVGMSLVGTGDHLLTGLLVLGCGHLLLAAAEAPALRRGRRLLALGVLVGLAFYANRLFAVAGIALLMTGLLARPAGGWGWGALARLALGLALGSAPLVAAVVRQGAATATMYQRGGVALLQDHPGVVFTRLASAIPDLAHAAWFPPGWAGQVAAWAWCLLVLGSLADAAWRQRGVVLGLLPGRDRARPGLEGYLVLFILGFVLAFSLTRFSVEPRRLFGYRYLAALYGPACLLAGLGLSRLPRRLGLSLGLLWWVPAGVALAWPLTWRSPLRAFDFPGCTWTNAAERALTAWQPDLGTAFSERLPQIPEPERAPFLVSLGSHLRGQVGEQVPVLDPRWRVHLRRGLTRREAQPGLPPEATSDLAGWLTRANAGQARALGQSLMGEIDASPLRRTHALSAAVTTTTVAPLCEGLGEGLVRAHKTPTDLLRWRIPWDGLLAPGCQAAFDRGLSEALIATYADDPAYRDRALALFGLEAP